jgi:hypothetical protein
MATSAQKIADSDWVRQAFLVPTNKSQDIDNRNRSFSTNKFKFGNTTLGGSLAINAPAQFTPGADVRVPGIFVQLDKNGEPINNSPLEGYGRYYGEVIEENSRIISMRFGVPQFNSLTTFFTGFYNSEAGVLARTGRGNSALFSIGKAAGYVVPLFSFPLLLLALGGNILRYLLHKPSSKYYFLKPAMPLYWNAVQSMVNAIAVNKGMVPRAFPGLFPANNKDDTVNFLDGRYPFTQSDLINFASKMPDILYEDGQINVYAMATRYQRLSRKLYLYMQQQYDATQTKDSGSASNYSDLSDVMEDLAKHGFRIDRAGTKSVSFQSYLASWFDAKNSHPSPAASNSQTTTGSAPNTSTADAAAKDSSPSVDTELAPVGDKAQSLVEKFDAFLQAELDDGSSFVSFRVDNDGPVHESFSNSVGESEIAGKINSMSGQARETNFNFAGGNISDSIAGKLVGGAVNGLKDLFAGAAAGIGMSGLAALGGSAFVDIPKHWQASSANLPSMSYTIQLTSPYGNKISQMFNLYVPLCMLLAAALPLSTGKQSYTSPFLVELYDRGRAQTRLGIIDSMSITRGAGNLGFSKSGSAMAIDVSFTVLDLSSIMHMPIIQGFNPLSNPTAGLFDDDTTFTDYMAILGSLSLNEQIYSLDRLKLSLTRSMANMNTWFSAAHTANWVGDLAPLQLISAFMAGRVNR